MKFLSNARKAVLTATSILALCACGTEQSQSPESKLTANLEKSVAPLYVIASAHIKPESMASFMSELEKILEPTRKEQGNIFYEAHIVEEDSKVVFYEAWKGEAGLNAHLSSEHIQAFAKSTQSMLTSAPVLERYRLVSGIDPRRSASKHRPASYRGIGKITVKKGGAQVFLDNLAPLVEHTRLEKGNFAYEILQSLEDPNKFVAYEVFKDKEAFDVHFNSAHGQEFLNSVAHFMAGPPALDLVTIVRSSKTSCSN